MKRLVLEGLLCLLSLHVWAYSQFENSELGQGVQLSSTAPSVARSFVGTTSLPTPYITEPGGDYSADSPSASFRTPRRSPGDPHSGGTSVDTPGAKLGDVVVPLLLMSVIYILIRTGKKVRRYIVICGKAFARMWHEAFAAIVRVNKDWY
ncbi:MAG: hypothetical protein IJT12_05965 [Paludibacteraceae bacterium]|nr:hypothetical protein [Paludibacteraceae bacterium]